MRPHLGIPLRTSRTTPGCLSIATRRLRSAAAPPVVLAILLLAASLSGAPADQSADPQLGGDVLSGLIWPFAGTGYAGHRGDGGPATSAYLHTPMSLAFDAAGNAYIACRYSHTVRRVAPNGIITTVAGTGVCDADYINCAAGYNGDQKLATQALLRDPFAVAVDSAGNLYIADTYNNRVRKVTNPGPTGVITTVAGDGTWNMTVEGAAATGTGIPNPSGIALDAQNNLYILQHADGGGGGWANRVVKVNAANGTVTTIVGVNTTQPGYGGDGGDARFGILNVPIGLAIDAAGALYIADNTNNRVRKVSGGIITTIAGTGAYDYTGNGGLATQATLRSPRGVTVDRLGNVYVADTFNQVIRQISATDQKIRAFVGGTGFGGPVDGSSALDGWLWNPHGMAVVGTNLYLTDTENQKVRRVEITGLSDATPPVITETVTGTLGNNGWYRSNVNLSWSVTDPDSPVASQVGCTPSSVTADTAGQAFTCRATSGGGSSEKTVTIKRDATAPTVTVTTPPNGATYALNAAVNAGYSCTDGGSGLASCVGPVANGAPISTSPAGAKTFGVTGTDNAGNSTTVTNNYTVGKSTPVVTWNNPAAITYGTALSGTQLNATANVPGTFAYTPGSGTMLNAGTHTLSVTFTPTDTTNYTNATKSVTIVVNKATPVITWANPAAITFGTPLSGTQLNATANAPGTFAYTPASGTILNAGAGQLLSVTFTPTNPANYTNATKTVSITVNKASPVITWNNPAAMAVGTPLSATQLNASANVPGTFVYTPAAGTVLAAGTHTLSVTFTPTNAANYTNATKTVSIDVLAAAAPTVTSVTPPTGSVTGGTMVTITGTGFVPGAIVSFGGTAVGSVLVLSATAIQATTPAHSAGAVNVVVTNPDAQRGTKVNGFTYVAGTGVANRMLPPCYVPGSPRTVTVAVDPATGVANYAVEDSHPAGWSVSNISHGGTLDAASGKVKWGPFFDDGTRTLTFVVTPPAAATGAGTFAGVASFDGTSVPIAGTSVVQPCATHPADTNNDWRLDVNEVTAYGAAWKRGDTWARPPNPIPIDYVTRAGYLWRSGEVYHLATADCPACWAPGAADRAWTEGGSSGTASSRAEIRPAGRVAAMVCGLARPRGSVTVNILAAPGDGTRTWAVEEYPPIGWAVVEAGDGGRFDRTRGVIRWGPFFDDRPRTLTYTMTVPERRDRVAALSGVMSIDGGSMSIRGARRIPTGLRTTIGDFDGDGKADLAVRDAGDGTWNLGRRAEPFGEPEDLAVPADYDGNGVVEMAVFRPSTGEWIVDGLSSFVFGRDGDVPVAADYDGDGMADAMIYHPATSIWQRPGITPVRWGVPGDEPVPADYTGDGAADLAVFRAATGLWLIENHSPLAFGRPGDVPVPADYDGDGLADIAVYRPSTGEWLILGHGTVDVGMGADEFPAALDIDGDGRAELCLYSPTRARWRCVDTLSGARTVRVVGSPGSRPVDRR